MPKEHLKLNEDGPIDGFRPLTTAEREASLRLRTVLEKIPFVDLDAGLTALPPGRHWTPSFALNLDCPGGNCQGGNRQGDDAGRSETNRLTLVCGVVAQPFPRQVRALILEMSEYLRELPPDALVKSAYPVILASHLSEQSRALCLEAGFGFADFSGSCRLCFDRIFIETQGTRTTSAAKREMRSPFTPKAAALLRILLKEPKRSWKVMDLAEASGVSLGHVSNLRKALINREWAEVGLEGLRLTRPDAVLDAWTALISTSKPGARIDVKRCYTTLHGVRLRDAIKAALAEAGSGAHAVLAGASAAQWLAPYVRVGSQEFYADALGEDILNRHLSLSPADKGANVMITRTDDGDILSDRIEPAPGIWTTGLVQTYLDLNTSGERHAEAADHLRRFMLDPLWKT